jgi:hypothetical protein
VSKWQKTVARARADATLRGIAAAIIATNFRRDPDPAAYAAFRDRAQEIGLEIPNEAYWSILLGGVARWGDCGEGPWDDEGDAVAFAEAEVGRPWRVEWAADGFRVMVLAEVQ